MIGLLIPAYNAGGSVGCAVTAGAPHVSRVVVVDDGSTDASGPRAAEAGAEVIRHPANRGKGAALRTGFRALLAAGAEAIITMDADLQHDAADIPRFVEAHRHGGADLIIGSRAAHFDRMSPGRRAGNRFSSGALRFFTGLTLPDSQSGFRLYARSFLEALTLRRDGYDAEVEALMEAVRQRRRVETIAIRLAQADGKATSSYRPWLDTYRMCRTVVHYSIVRM